MASNDFALTPKKQLKRKSYKLKVKVDGPRKRTSPMVAVVRLAKSGKVTRKMVKLNRRGKGALKVAFNRKQTKRVYVVAVNASTRFNCGAGDFTYSCKGGPKDDGVAFTLKFKVVNTRR